LIGNRIKALGQEEGISSIRIINHSGVIRFSIHEKEVGKKAEQDVGVCYPCHSREKALETLPERQQDRIYKTAVGTRILGTINPIYQEKRCSSPSCHIPSPERRVLGVIEVGRSLTEVDGIIDAMIWKGILFALLLFIGIIGMISFSMVVFVNRPIKDLLYGMRKLSRGEYNLQFSPRKDEMGELQEAFSDLAQEIKVRTQELERSQREYKELFERVPCYIAVLNQDYRIVQANGYFTETFGNRIDDHCYEAYKGRSRKCENCSADLTFADGLIHSSEEVGRNRAGRETDYIVYTAPVTDEGGRVTHVIEMSVDITQTKELENRLRVSQEFQENLIQNSIHGIVATDRDGRIVIFNRAAEALLQHGSSEVIGSRDLERVFPREFYSKIIRSLDGHETVESGKMIAHETFIMDKDGERIPVEFSGVILFETERPIGSVGFFQDLRMIKALEREKSQAERLAIVGQTVAGLAHGVKNILTGLEGGVYVVNTGFKRKEETLVQKGWDMLERNIAKISTLVQDLLSYSKHRAPQYEQVDPSDLLTEVFKLFEGMARKDGIRLEIDLDQTIGKVSMDPKGIHTCLTNLVSNALDACKMKLDSSGCSVTMKTIKEEGCGVVFGITDTGIGMDEETKGKLFSIFFSTKGTSGTGLGLLVTHKIVVEHHGVISVDSQPGKGSTFAIKLPEVEGEPPREG
jgi:PAS domain S-box-containing protein